MAEPSSLRTKWRMAATATIILLVLATWVQFLRLQPLAPPDFYRYHMESEQLWRGNGGAMHPPLLYPLISGAMGRVLALLVSRREAFILAGKILSLLGGLGIFFALRVLVSTISRPLAMVWSGAFMLSPLVLKFIAFPITDLPFLALLLGSIAAFFHGRQSLAIMLALAAAGIRFEGFLLLSMVILFAIPWKKRRALLLVPAVILLAADLFYLAARVTPRLLHYIEQWVLGRTPSLWQKPVFLFRVITDNLLFFVPAQWPGEVRLSMAVVMLICLIAGAVAAWRLNPRAAALIIIFMLGILEIKGYILFEGSWRMHTRRLLPVLGPAWGLIGMGVAVLATRMKRTFGIAQALPWVLFPGAVAIVLVSPGLRPWWPALALFPVAVYSINPHWKRTPGRIAMTLALVLFLSACAGIGFRGSLPLVEAMPNTGGIAVADWLNTRGSTEDQRILMFSNSEMIRYYLDKPAQWVEWEVDHWQGRISIEEYWGRFLARLKNENIDLIVIDRYLPGTSSRKHRSLKFMLWRRHADKRWFRSFHAIKWKGEMRALILVPVKEGISAKD